jgi:hypothetical protein
MILNNLKIRYINLDRSIDRLEHVVSAFRGLDLIRIPAVDGMQCADGSYDEVGRPNWGSLPDDVDPSFEHFQMFATTYGCNLSHHRAMEDFLATEELWTIIVEDDTEPVGDLNAIEVPDNCDWYYLIGANHPGGRLALYPDGQVRSSRTLAAYALSRRAAELALLAMRPIQYFQTDHQIPLRCFESTLRGNWAMPAWEELPYRLKAYGQRESIVKHSRHAAVSTFTIDGRKPWIPDCMLPSENSFNPGH